jgi:DNA polymerase III subunit beta
MKVECSRAKLAEAFSIASMVVPHQTSIPMLANVRLTASKGTGGPSLELACTDLEFGLRLSVPASEVSEEGVLVLPAGRMGGILRESGDDQVAVDSAGHVASVRLDGAAFKLVGADPADFPEIPDFDEAAAASVPSEDLGEMIRRTRFAVANDNVRYTLTGQLFEVKGGELRMAASDGKRLAYVKGSAGGGNGRHRDIRVVVPVKAMDLLEKVLGEDDDRVGLNVDETRIRMRTKRAVVFSRLIEGMFPDYEAVVPKSPDKTLTASRAALLAAVRNAALMTTDRTRAVKLILAPGGKCALLARTQDVGEARVEFQGDYKGEPVEIVLNPDYLKAVTAPTVEARLVSRTGPAVFRAGKDYVYVVMPLSIEI